LAIAEKIDDKKPVQNNILDNIPPILPILPLRDIVIFPYMIFPVLVGREHSIKAATMRRKIQSTFSCLLKGNRVLRILKRKKFIKMELSLK